ncbi:APC family permease [Microlunatus flavus]|uniref:Amino acid efflux transporter n=1 Tax=Microlunatus flavus TaxID=1036181 RepID=A0A1H9FT58_9ACTN|nr:APC family permease [Microlunatus flavus]SEQ41077.1 amino acid efflux transporter [Microlunatus flavus]
MTRITARAAAPGLHPDRVTESRVGTVRGTALFVAAIVGPGILTLPALAAGEAGPASLVTLGVLLTVSAPIAFTFAALNAAAPAAKGVAGYATVAFGPLAGRLVSAWFRSGVPIGVPALGLIGGGYVAEATGGGKATAVTVAAGICAVAVVASVLHRPGSGVLTLLLSAALTVLIVGTAVVALPHGHTASLRPFAPGGLAAVAASALVLTWVLTGWEAVTNFTDVLRDPRRTLPRVTGATLVVVALLYAAVAVPEILVLGPTAGGTQAPVAAMLRIATGSAGAVLAAVIAVVIATGNSIAYVGSLAEMGTTTRPTRGARAARTGRASALVVPVIIIAGGLAAAALTSVSTGELVSVCAGSQVPVYVAGLAAGIKVLPTWSRSWWSSVVATAAVALLLVPAGRYLLIPAVVALGVVARYAYQCRSPGVRTAGPPRSRAEQDA